MAAAIYAVFRVRAVHCAWATDTIIVRSVCCHRSELRRVLPIDKYIEFMREIDSFNRQAITPSQLEVQAGKVSANRKCAWQLI